MLIGYSIVRWLYGRCVCDCASDGSFNILKSFHVLRTLAVVMYDR